MAKIKLPFTNAHVHIFTGDHVPAYIAKKMIPWPLYYFVNIHCWVWIYKKFKKEKREADQLNKGRITLLGYLKTNWVTMILYSLVIGYLLLHAVYYLLDILGAKTMFRNRLPDWLDPAIDNVLGLMFFKDINEAYQLAIIVFVAFMSINARKLLWWILTTVIKPLGFIKSDRIEFAKRYLDILEFTKYGNQIDIFYRLRAMYPANSKMVVLPMDMEYMGAGKVKESYLDQIKTINDEISNVKSSSRGSLIPFVFVDPRRIREEDGDQFFKYIPRNGPIELEDCLLKKYLEPKDGDPYRGNFKGIKIYPALGYYPTDRDLLPLWLYCAQNGIPITTHCTFGTMFYRGKIDRQMFTHPVYRDSQNNPVKFVTPSNKDLQINFSHPLNYLALVEPLYLHDYLTQLADPEIDLLFGKTSTGYQRDLRNLKINFAHYGGTDEWHRFIKEDRNSAVLDITRNAGTGLDFFKSSSKDDKNPLSKPYWLWENQDVDWFSVITSMMWQYPNVYADISYVLHNNDLTSMLRWVLKDPKLEKRILFGTDFYVVRNHNSEKELVADMSEGLSDRMMHYIARVNPDRFLTSAFG